MASFLGVIKKIFKALSSIGKRFGAVGSAFTNFAGALFGGLLAVFKSFKIGGESLGVNLAKIFVIIGYYIQCGAVFIYTLPKCFLIHVLMLVITLAYYIFFALPVLILEKILDIDLKPSVDQLFQIISAGDDVIFGFTGIYITKLPPRLTKMCYSCKGRPYRTDTKKKLDDAGRRINRDFNEKIPKTFRPVKRKMNTAMKKFRQAFS